MASNFDYKYAGSDNVGGRSATIIEFESRDTLTPAFGKTAVRVWIDTFRSEVLRMEHRSSPLENPEWLHRIEYARIEIEGEPFTVLTVVDARIVVDRAPGTASFQRLCGHVPKLEEGTYCTDRGDCPTSPGRTASGLEKDGAFQWEY